MTLTVKLAIATLAVMAISVINSSRFKKVRCRREPTYYDCMVGVAGMVIFSLSACAMLKGAEDTETLVKGLILFIVTIWETAWYLNAMRWAPWWNKADGYDRMEFAVDMIDFGNVALTGSTIVALIDISEAWRLR